MRRSISLVAATAGLALALSACGGDSGGTDTTAPATDATTTSAAPGDSGTLTIWVDETRMAPVKAASAAFEEETGTTVELVQKNYDDIRADFLAQVPTGEGPDITVGAHDWLGEFIQNGVVAPIELGDKAGDFEEVAVDAFTYEGQVYGLPYAIENIALIRNTDLAPEAPATWDELIAAGQAAGTDFPVLLQSDGESGDPYTYYPLQISFGAPVFEQNEDGSYSNELGMGGENGENFARWLAEQGAAGNLDVDTTYDIVVEQFKNGNSPFIIGGPWMLEQFEGLNLSIDHVPSAGGQPAQPFTGVQGFYVNQRSENQLVANDFLTNYIATVDAQVALFEAGDRTPALTEAADQVVANDPIAAGFREVGADAVPMPSIPEMASVWTFWGNTEAGIVSGSLDPVQGWQKMISDIEGAISAAS